MRIGEYDLTISFMDPENTASAHCEPRYLEHNINFDLSRIEWKLVNLKGFDLEEYVVHELVHQYNWRGWALTEQLLVGKDCERAWKWMLEEIYEEATSRVSKALVETKREFLQHDEESTVL